MNSSNTKQCRLEFIPIVWINSRQPEQKSKNKSIHFLGGGGRGRRQGAEGVREAGETRKNYTTSRNFSQSRQDKRGTFT